jgi:A/G-specific adenine glycosylase
VILNDTFSGQLDIDLSLAKTATKFKAPSGKETKLRAAFLRHAKAVQHTFSHIKKSYLPIYLALEGGENPPDVRPYTKPNQPKKSSRKGKKRKLQSDSSDAGADEAAEQVVGELKWVREEKLEEHM